MNEIINLIIKSAFMDNMVFAYFLGMCSFLAVSKKVSTAKFENLLNCFLSKTNIEKIKNNIF